MGHLQNAMKPVVAIASIFLCVVLLSSCGGSSTGGGGAGGSEEVQTPDVLNIGLSILQDNPLTITSIVGTDDVTSNIGSLGPIKGTYEVKTGLCTLTDKNNALIFVTTDLWEVPQGSLTIQITTPYETTNNGTPDAGSLQIITGSDTIAIVVTKSPHPGVNLSLNNGAAEFLTWDNFRSLLGSAGAPLWQQQASLSSFIMDTILSQFFFSYDSITSIESNDTELEKSLTKSIEIPCDAFSKNTPPGNPPAGIPDMGLMTLLWTDSKADHQVGPRDDFSWTFANCWENDPASKVDTLKVGSVRLLGFVENTMKLNGKDVFTSLGFIPSADNKPGGIIYNDLNIYETRENSPGVFTIDAASRMVLNGGFSIILTEPTQ